MLRLRDHRLVQVAIVLICTFCLLACVYIHHDSAWDPRWGLFDGGCWMAVAIINLASLDLRRRRLIARELFRRGLVHMGIALLLLSARRAGRAPRT